MRGSAIRRDAERTSKAHFLDPRSHYTIATHKGPAQCFLFGRDVEAQRARIYIRDKGRCVDCGMALDLSTIEPPHGLQRSHVVPRSKQGDDSDSNVRSRDQQCHYQYDHGKR